MPEDVGDDPGAEIAFVVEFTGAATLARDGEGVRRLDGDFEIERERHGQAIKPRS